MDLTKIPLLEAMTKRMSWLGERQSVLAQNIANADTPGYVAKDVQPPSFAELVTGAAAKLPMAVTEPGHITPVSDDGGFKITGNKPKERSLDGNAVQLEDQMMKVSDTANDYALTTSLYRQQLGLIKLALGHSSG
jgi:flagellar basal-body rod protein FlgB